MERERELKCPHCQSDDERMMEVYTYKDGTKRIVCAVCSRTFEVKLDSKSQKKV